jgi:hypothetical protein
MLHNELSPSLVFIVYWASRFRFTSLSQMTQDNCITDIDSVAASRMCNMKVLVKYLLRILAKLFLGKRFLFKQCIFPQMVKFSDFMQPTL